MKKIILLTVIFLATACTTNYQLEYDGKTFKESIKLNKVKEVDLLEFDVNPDTFNDKKIYVSEEEESYYESELIGERQPYKLNFKYTYKVDEFAKANAITMCYEDYALIDEKDSLYVEVRKKKKGHWICDYENKITFTLKSDYKIIKSNANSAKDNVHIWNLKDGDLGEGKIFFLIDKKVKAKENISIPKYEIIIGLLGIVMIVAFIGVQIFLRKRVEN